MVYPTQGSLTQKCRRAEEIVEAKFSTANELVNLNQLIEDVVSLLPASAAGNKVYSYDLAAGLPLIHGDYRLIRRRLLDLLGDLNRAISLRTDVAPAERFDRVDTLTDAGFSDRYVVVQITALDPEWGVRELEVGSTWQFVFRCAN